jgi:5-methylcytosine-specific restriction endonuclease McrA
VRSWGGRKAQTLTAACLAAWGTMCHLCGRDGADTADHVVPRSAGGLDVLANLRPAHAACNYARQDTPLDEWRRTHPLPSRPVLTPSRDW